MSLSQRVVFLLVMWGGWLAAARAEEASTQTGPARTVLCRQGDDQVHTYRIPGLATTPKGTLVAVFDLRHKGAGDLPADIDIGARRSVDGGRTWGATQVVLDFDASQPGSRGNGVGDPTVLVDQLTGHVLVFGLWSQGNHAWHGSGPGLRPDETGQLVFARSVDDGVSWSKPVNITDKIRGRDPTWRLCFNGPGRGIQLRGGALVLPAQFRDAAGEPHSCFLYSPDSGETWAISPPAIPQRPGTSEAQLAELKDGALLLSMRDESRSGKRGWARFDWKEDLAQGKWSEPWFTVPDPTCMASLVSHPDGLLLFANPNSARERKALTIRTSADGGKTWSEGKLLDPRPCAYSCLSVLADGSLGILYECGDKNAYETLTFARFPLSWVLGK